MIALIQRVREARVEVNDAITGAIGRGVLALIGIEREDTQPSYERLLQRILAYRIFPDDAGRMNLSLKDIDGGLLLVPQFTLAADTRKGNRPGFSQAAEPEYGKVMFDALLTHATKSYPHVKQGVFGADMQVSLINDGPVTFWLQNP